MKRKLDSDERPRFYLRVTVAGSGEFPVDMLRYDSCWPSDQEAVSNAFCSDLEYRTVEVSKYAMTKETDFTAGRWASFGWKVLD